MKCLVLLGTTLLIGTVAAGFAKPHQQHGGPPPPHHPLHRFYAEAPPKIIASPKPRSYSNAQPPPNYRTVNPMYIPYRTPRSELHPQMVAAPSNTPVLVLKKDHARPVLSSAVHASKRSEQQPNHSLQQLQQQQQQQQQQQHHTQIPTITMERPHHDEQPQAPPNMTTTKQPQQQQQHQQRPQRSSESMEHEPAVPLSQEEPHPVQQEEGKQGSGTPPTASAERRMFFESVATNSELAHQVSGPRPVPTGPSTTKHATASSNIHQQQHRPVNHHQQRPTTNRRDDTEEEDDDEQNERITRQSHPYQGGSQFQYPPPQGNYIAQGPTRVPVKYQQGVVGQKPHHPQQFIGGHPQQQQHGRKPQPQQGRPYKQRIQQQQQQRQPGSEEPLSEELEDEEDAQPDRLTELLATSKFACGGKKDGYYADDTLNCEVFHYCQDGGKHSWLCPNGFAFHQIHLICVPPSSDNICKQSSNYHFVNEYLYKPINEKEANTYNESLKYADRYFPDGYSNGAGDMLLPYHPQQHQSHQEDDDEEDEPRHHRPAPRPQQHHNPYVQQQHPQSPRAGPHHQQQQQQSSPYNPYATLRPQVHGPQTGGFIPSQQIRGPVVSSRGTHYSGSPQQQHSSGSQLHPLTILPQKPISKPSSKSVAPPPPSSSNPSVFFSPESINIPLNQRRPIPNPHPSHHPQIFRPSPQLHAKKRSGGAPHHPHSSRHHHHPTSSSTSRSKNKFEDYEY